MLKIPGYKTHTQIYESNNSIVYRAYSEVDGQPVILKILQQDYPTLEQIARYKQEYELTRNLNLKGTVKVYSLEKYQNRPVLILEDFGGESLKILMDSWQLNLEEFLLIAIQISKILGEIHQEHIIHKDINPSNIVINRETEQLKIIDFGISTVLSQENTTFKNPTVLEGTLAYISPEQTGRMNRAIDYRSDFYSLGATFYELLLGKLPFDVSDPMELVHCHLAKKPTPPSEIVPEIPKAVSDIVMKLLAKTAEERYQSAYGIQADLENCLAQLKSGGQIAEFSLGMYDLSDKFQIPQKLYGRESEIETLLTAFERVSEAGDEADDSSRSEMMLIAGYSGIGKSALVQEIYKPITEKRGYFISGKFDQFQRNIPYTAIIQAFSSLIRQLLTESEQQLEQWRDRLLTAVGINGQIIIDAIAEVELIIGKQPSVDELAPTESQNRFNFVFQNFVKVFTQKEHPLVLFLDDLQWADSASLKWIERLMIQEDSQYLLLIGAYRDNEVDGTHPLMLTLSEIQQQGAIVNQVSLASLALTTVNQLIADTLHCDTERAKPLAELVFQKTQGNPFFMNEFLKSLYAEGLLYFEHPKSTISTRQSLTLNCETWQWNLEQIQNSKITNNVVDLMAAKIQKLSKSTQKILKLAACIGNQFDLKTLSIVHESSQDSLAAELFTAVQSGLILTIGDNYKFLVSTESDRLEITYKFVHDRVQQAAYALIDEDSKCPFHLKIGRLLWQNTPSDEQTTKIFEIVDHFNLGQELISEESEKIELANLNLSAGKKAKDSTAYAAALHYIISGLSCLSGEFWSDSYNLAFTLYKEQADLEYLNGNIERAKELINLLILQAKTTVEKAEIYNMLVLHHTMKANYPEAIKTAMAALQLLGIDLPETNLKAAFEAEIVAIKNKLGDRDIFSLIDAPETHDSEQIITIQLLINLITSTFASDYDKFLIVSTKVVNLSLDYGHSKYSSMAYSNYSNILGSILGNYQLAYEFGRLALKLSEKFNNLSFKCKDSLIIGFCINPWVKPLKLSDTILNEGYQAGLSSGELQFTGFMLHAKIVNFFSQGMNLGQILEKIIEFLQFAHRTNNQWSIDTLQAFQLPILNLTGQTQEKLNFDRNNLTEEQFLFECESHQGFQPICIYQIIKSIVLYLHEELFLAKDSVKLTASLIHYCTGIIIVAECNFYDCLILSGLYSTASESERKEYLEKLESNQKQMKIWADNCPENFLHKYLLVAAEIARISGQDLAAMDLYDRAILSARENEFIQCEALANELAAKFWLHRGKEEFAQSYLKKAQYCYQLWGAQRKVEDLSEKYPHLLVQSQTTTTDKQKSTISTSSRDSSSLDLSTVMKATRAISGEIVLDKLLAKLMQILIENAGAQKGFLILQREGQLQIEAKAAVNLEEVLVETQALSPEILPLKVINYVERTRTDIVLNNAAVDGQFTADPYIAQQELKSLLCAAIVNQGNLIGMVYLENNLTTAAFTSQRLEIVKILSSQAAISLENALLYQTLEQKVEERTAQLAEANQEITILNDRLKAENIRMSAELDVTRKLQHMILPTEDELSQIPGLEIAGFMEPAEEVGGDYYDVIQSGNSIKIGIGDVTGHGLESGVLMIMVQTAVRALLENNETDSNKFLDTLNRTIYKNVTRMNSDKNLSLSLLDYEEGILRLSGQHEEAIVVRSGGEIERIDTMNLGFPIGLEADIADFVAQIEIPLNSGDVVVLYTDGITEAEDINGMQYGLDRLTEVISRNWQLSTNEIKQVIIDDVREHIGEQKVYDDITMVVLKKK